MQRRDVRGVCADHVLAWVIVLLLRAGLLRLAHSAPRATNLTGMPYRAIRVTFIEQAPPSLTPTPRRAVPQLRQGPAPGSRPHTDAATIAVPASETDNKPLTAPPVGLPLVTVLMAQARLHARADAERLSQAAPIKPFAMRRQVLPEQPVERFKMRKPLALAAVVAGIGSLLGGPGYGGDPCEELADQIATLALQGTSPELSQDLESERNVCRPSR